MLRSLAKRSQQISKQTLKSNNQTLLFQSGKRWFDELKVPDGLKEKKLPEMKEGEEAPDFMQFTFASPNKEMYSDVPVRQVGIPGADGRFTISAGHIPVMTELQPGKVSVYHEKSEQAGRQEHFFVAGGIAIYNANHTLEIAAVEACYMDDVDTNELKVQLQKARDAQIAAQTEKEKVEAEIKLEALESIERTLGDTM